VRDCRIKERRKVRAKDSRCKRPPNPETEKIVPVVGGEPAAVGRAEELRIVIPDTAADDTVTAISADPSRTICGRSVVVAVIAILDPLPDIARWESCAGIPPARIFGHVVEAERIGGE
jgi:hypothetical protein